MPSNLEEHQIQHLQMGGFTFIPPGAVMDYAGTAAPTGWLVCDGSAISRTTYSALFNAIGIIWGDGDGINTFNLPDARGRTRVGAGTGSGLSARTLGSQDIGSESVAHTHSLDHDHGSFTSAAESGHTHAIDHDHGSFTSASHTLTTTEIPSHTHGTGTLVNAAESTHTHGIGSYVAANESSHTHGAGSYTQTLGGSISTVANAAGSYVIGDANTSAITGTSGAGSAHTHTLSGTSAAGSSHNHTISGSTASAGSDGGHTHSVDVPSIAATSGASSGHTHSVDMPAFTGTSGAASDASVMQPSAVYNVIIKY